MRAFACAALLRAAVESGEDDGSMEATLAQCLASAKVLGDEMNDAAAAFLTWGIPRINGHDQWLFAFSLLVVASRFRSDCVSDSTLRDAVAWVFAEERESRERYRHNPADPPPGPFGVTYGFWKPLADELIGNAADIQAADLRKDLELIGALILDA
jgi:hypothetical protein